MLCYVSCAISYYPNKLYATIGCIFGDKLTKMQTFKYYF